MSLLTKILESGFRLGRNVSHSVSLEESVLLTAEVRGFVLIVTDLAVYRAVETDGPLGFTVHQLIVI